jgi:cytochrome c-type biogenesis protein CcmF
MKEVLFEGENLFIGNLGHFLVVLSFVAALLSFLFYWNLNNENNTGKKLGRISFIIHAFASIAVFATLFVIIQNHLFEYHYAWKHSSTKLPLRYLVSCFWEGQEGSFLLWLLWHAVLGIILIFTTGKWERWVMMVLALSQVVLASMLLGVDFGFYKIGSSPFELLRDVMSEASPIFTKPDYLKVVTDGTGLNPLLQNYWMVIHPPTLFLGFALTIVPYAFAIAGIAKRDYIGWIKPALPWALFGALVLGMGIIMGGFWAYESLSFGGYWAWDPVENASLVPWLMLIAGIHLMAITRHTKTAVVYTFLFIISSFILVLYATFLTRSGVLGETSVHSFTDLKLAGQLMQFVVLFIWLPLLMVKQHPIVKYGLTIVVISLILILPFFEKPAFYPLLILSIGGIIWFAIQLNKQLTGPKTEEEKINSREFWLFIGVLVLLLSSIQITFNTSIPVLNKILGTSFAPPSDVIYHYNKFQLPMAIIILLLTGFSLFLNYKKTLDPRKLYFNILLSLFVGILLTAIGIFVFKISGVVYIIFLFACFFSIAGNSLYVISKFKRQKSLSGAAITHFGFGLMLIGVLVSSVNKTVITSDTTGFLGNYPEEARAENMLLFKDVPNRLGNYWVTYKGDSIAGDDIYFQVHYQSVDEKEEFTLWPNTQISDNEGLLPNPDTRHYLTYDVYTHITSVPKEPDSLDWKNPQEFEVAVGDSIFLENTTLVFQGIDQNLPNKKIGESQLFGANILILKNGKEHQAKPIFVITKNTFFGIHEELPELGLKVGFEVKNTETGPVAVIATEETDPVPKYIVMKAIIFPYINLLWLGTIIMLIGFGVATYKKIAKR